MSDRAHLTDLRARYAGLCSALVSDALRELNFINQALTHSISPLVDGMLIAGPAFTVKSGKEATRDYNSLDIKGHMRFRAEVMQAIPPGAVVVWDTDEDNVSGHWGAMMTRMAKKRGCVGAVIDGGLRDTVDVLKQDFPVFCRYRTPNGILGRHKWEAYQQPIRIGGVTIYPGDYVLADMDGVVVVPGEIIHDVLERAEDKSRHERQVEEWIRNGKSPREIADEGGLF